MRCTRSKETTGQRALGSSFPCAPCVAPGALGLRRPLRRFAWNARACPLYLPPPGTGTARCRTAAPRRLLCGWEAAFAARRGHVVSAAYLLRCGHTQALLYVRRSYWAHVKKIQLSEVRLMELRIALTTPLEWQILPPGFEDPLDRHPDGTRESCESIRM